MTEVEQGEVLLLGADHDAVRYPEPMPGSVRPVQVGGSPPVVGVGFFIGRRDRADEVRCHLRRVERLRKPGADVPLQPESPVEMIARTLEARIEHLVELAVAGEAPLGEAWPDAVVVGIQGHGAMDRKIEGLPGGGLDVDQREELTDALQVLEGLLLALGRKTMHQIGMYRDAGAGQGAERAGGLLDGDPLVH